MTDYASGETFTYGYLSEAGGEPFMVGLTTSRGISLPDDVGQRLGTVASLVEEARQGKVDSIYITFPMRAEARIHDVLKQLTDTTASVYIVPDFFVFELLQQCLRRHATARLDHQIRLA